MVIQSPPNAGSLVATGLLTVDPDTPVGFDIYTRLRDGVAITNSGFASLVVGGVTGFYRINFVTGQAILIDYFDQGGDRHRYSAQPVLSWEWERPGVPWHSGLALSVPGVPQEYLDTPHTHKLSASTQAGQVAQKGVG